VPGAIDQLPSGKWRIRVPALPDPITGARRYTTELWPANTARRTLTLRAAELINRGAAPKARALTVRVMLDDWLTSGRLARSTAAKSRYAIAHVTRAVLDLRADRVTVALLDDLYRHLQQLGVGNPTVRTLHGCLSAAFGLACRRGQIASNPCLLASPPPPAPTKVSSISLADIDKLHALARETDPQTGLWMQLHLVTGARRGEILAVRWSAIDYAEGVLRIAASIDTDVARTAGGTKTGKERSVSVDAGTLRLAREWQQVQRLRAAAEPNVGLARDPYLLSLDDDSGRPWRPDYATALFATLCRRAGVTGATLHDLRHAAATRMIAAGVAPHVVAKRLGHDDVGTTLRIYAHVLQEQDIAAGELLAKTYRL
jgi:integrase